MAYRVAAVAFFLTPYFLCTQAKIYHRCELAYELRDVHEIPEHQLATWLCIANYESHFNTSAHNPGSGDHGLFQISELYWCSPPGVGYACGLPCAAFKDDDIEDDVICVRRIYREHQRLSGDGFTAWVVYNLHCRNQAHVNSFIEGCFDDENLIKYKPPSQEQYQYQPNYEAMNLPTVTTVMEYNYTTINPFIGQQVFTTTEEIPKKPSPSPTSTEYTKPSSKFKPSTFSQLEKSTSSEKPATPNLLSSPKPVKPLQLPSSTLGKLQEKSSTLKPTNPKTTSAYRSTTSKLSPFTSSSKPKLTSTFKNIVSTTSKPPKFSFTSSKPVPSSIQTSAISTSQFITSSINPSSIKDIVSITPRLPKIFSSPSKPIPSLPQTTSHFTIPTVKPSPIRNFVSITPRPPPKTFFTSRKSITSTIKPITLSTSRFSTIKTKVNPAVSSSSASFISPTPNYYKSTFLKPRETKTYKYKPFEFEKNQAIYAVVNKPTYSLSISSNGFKFVRTV